MKRKQTLSLIAFVLVLTLALAGCGAGEGNTKAPALKDGEALELTEWTMNATAWSSPNGATVNLTATPNGYAEGQSAQFCVRLEGEEIVSVPCSWDGSVYTASADLNAEDGYCYFVILTAADGTQSEVAINTPTAPTDDSLINMATSLNAYCELSISGSEVENGKLVVTDGTVTIQLPQLTLDTGAVTCQSAALVLRYNNQDASRQEMTPPQSKDGNVCLLDLSGISFEIPADIEDDHQLSLQLDVTLSNGHTLTAPGGTWYYLDGDLLLAVG